MLKFESVVEHLTHNSKDKGLSLAVATGVRIEKMGKSVVSSKVVLCLVGH